MHLFHCWHRTDTNRVEIYVKTRCKKEPLQSNGQYGEWNKCCICGKEKLLKYYREGLG